MRVRYYLGRSQSTIPADDIDAWSESGGGAFEVREIREGDAARAALYFYAIYESADEAFLEQMKEALLAWDAGDRPGPEELRRSALIKRWQGNVNPFILDTTLTMRL